MVIHENSRRNRVFGNVYYAICQVFLSTIDHLDYHPSMHVENGPKNHTQN